MQEQHTWIPLLYCLISLFALRNTILNEQINKTIFSIFIKLIIIMFYRWYRMLFSNITHEQFLDGSRVQELAFLVFPLFICVIIDLIKLFKMIYSNLQNDKRKFNNTMNFLAKCQDKQQVKDNKQDNKQNKNQQ